MEKLQFPFKLISLVFFTIVFFLNTTCKSSETEQKDKSTSKEQNSEEKKAFTYLSDSEFSYLTKKYSIPERDKWQKPETVLAILGNIQGKKIADLGAGIGYFTFFFAQNGANVLALEVDPKFIRYIETKKFKNAELAEKIQSRTIGFNDTSLQKDEVDILFVCNTFRYLDRRSAYFKKVYENLIEGGQILVIDFKMGEFPEGPPNDLKVPLKTAVQELKQAGFQNVSFTEDELPYQYLILAKK